MAPSDIWICIDGYDEREKLQWERMRELAFWIHVHSMATKKSKSPQRFRPLPWDEERTGVKRAKTPQEVYDEWLKNKERRKNGRSNQSKDTG